MNIQKAVGALSIFLVCSFFWCKLRRTDVDPKTHKTSLDVPMTQEIEEAQPLQHLSLHHGWQSPLGKRTRLIIN